MKRGAGDIAFVSPPLPGLAGIGATGEGAHAPGETMDLSAQPINTKRAALLMYRLSRLDAKANLEAAAAQSEVSERFRYQADCRNATDCKPATSKRFRQRRFLQAATSSLRTM